MKREGRKTAFAITLPFFEAGHHDFQLGYCGQVRIKLISQDKENNN